MYEALFSRKQYTYEDLYPSVSGKPEDQQLQFIFDRSQLDREGVPELGLRCNYDGRHGNAKYVCEEIASTFLYFANAYYKNSGDLAPTAKILVISSSAFIDSEGNRHNNIGHAVTYFEFPNGKMCVVDPQTGFVSAVFTNRQDLESAVTHLEGYSFNPTGTTFGFRGPIDNNSTNQVFRDAMNEKLEERGSIYPLRNYVPPK